MRAVKISDKHKKAVNKAVQFLKKNSKPAHGLDHHKAVWISCKKIVLAERLTVNLPNLKVASFWHDVLIRGMQKKSIDEVKNVCNYLDSYLPKIGFSKHEVKNVTESILHHEFKDSPSTKEGLVLQDADKLEVVSLERFLNLYNLYKRKDVDYKLVKSYFDTGIRRLPLLIEKFHYDYTKRLAKTMIRKNIDNQKFVSIIKEFGLGKKLVKNKRKLNL